MGTSKGKGWQSRLQGLGVLSRWEDCFQEGEVWSSGESDGSRQRGWYGDSRRGWRAVFQRHAGVRAECPGSKHQAKTKQLGLQRSYQMITIHTSRQTQRKAGCFS